MLLPVTPVLISPLQVFPSQSTPDIYIPSLSLAQLLSMATQNRQSTWLLLLHCDMAATQKGKCKRIRDGDMLRSSSVLSKT